jgi:G3E family GTPase
VIVNDMTEINIDAELVRSGDAAIDHVEERMVELTNGCICCTLRRSPRPSPSPPAANRSASWRGSKG